MNHKYLLNTLFIISLFQFVGCFKQSAIENEKMQESVPAVQSASSLEIDSLKIEIINKLGILLTTDWADTNYKEIIDAKWTLTDGYDGWGLNSGGYSIWAYEYEWDGGQIILYSYALPSFTEDKEEILSASFQLEIDNVELVINAQQIIGEYLSDMGFYVQPAKDYFGWGSGSWKNVEFVSNDLISGNLFQLKKYSSDPSNTGTYIKLNLKHSKYKELRFSEDHCWDDYSFNMPNELITELEKLNISSTLSDSTWEKIKPLGQSFSGSESFLKAEHRYEISMYINAYMAVDKVQSKPIYKILQKYLVRYIVLTSRWIDLTEDQINWLSENQLVKYYGGPSMSYGSSDTIYESVSSQSPDSYWGQYAFVQLIKQRGFDKSLLDTVLIDGNAFVNKYPNSKFIGDVYFYMGKAEQNWVYFGSTKNNEYFDWKIYEHKVKSSSKKAVEYYNKAIEHSGTKYIDHLKYVLPRLKLGLSGGCTYFIHLDV